MNILIPNDSTYVEYIREQEGGEGCIKAGFHSVIPWTPKIKNEKLDSNLHWGKCESCGSFFYKRKANKDEDNIYAKNTTEELVLMNDS